MAGNDVRNGRPQKNIRSFHHFTLPLATVLLFKKIFFTFASAGTFASITAWPDATRQS
jgi:hypothetical protein